MAQARLRHLLEELLARADVRVDGDRPWDLRVHRDAFFSRVLSAGSLGVGESYVEGWWDCEQLDEFFCRVLRVDLDALLVRWPDRLNLLASKFFNLQRISRAFQVGKHHYDLGDDLFESMLGPTMTYSGAYWPRASCLEEAQEAKLDLVCRKLELAPGMRVLDVGCGWGGAARFAAVRYGVDVVGVTVSSKQAAYAQQLCRGLPVEIRLLDYRFLPGRAEFDRVFSLGMFEHVGAKNYAIYMDVVRRYVKRDGRFLLQTIGANRTRDGVDPWISRYIFPNSMLPSIKRIAAASEQAWVLEDWHVLGADYDRTLLAWFHNFEEHWPTLAPRYGERFRRMWTYYLLCCAGAFRARKIQLWQVLFSPEGILGGCPTVR